MTTLPGRFDRLALVFIKILTQSVPVAWIELNVPNVCKRTGEAYVIPAWLTPERFPRVKIFRTDDLGPATKIVPTLLRHRNEPDTFIWSVDDDMDYRKDWLAVTLAEQERDPGAAWCVCGGYIVDDSFNGVLFQERPDVFEGFAGVVYPPNCIGDDFSSYIAAAVAHVDCLKSDDLILSNYLWKRGIAIRQVTSMESKLRLTDLADGDIMNLPMDYGMDDPQALHKLDGGHIARYKKVMRWLRKRKLLYITPRHSLPELA